LSASLPELPICLSDASVDRFAVMAVEHFLFNNAIENKVKYLLESI